MRRGILLAGCMFPRRFHCTITPFGFQLRWPKCHQR
ncbi:hypothetical protein ID866_5598 [Astraeus odoratus]|nr:hypothetical protein ID866_5598 [Astraeus odoratus]